MTERPEHAVNGSPAQDFSITKFFHDAYDKGIVKAVEDCPKEAAVTAAGVAAGTAAAVYLTKGGALAEMALGAGGKAGPSLTSAAESLIDRAVPITAESRAAAASADVLKMSPSQREAAIGKVEKHAAETAGAGLKSPFAGFEEIGYRHVPYRGLPITAESRAAAASADVMKMSPLQYEAAIGKVEKHAAETAGAGLKSPFSGFEQAGYKHVPFRGLPITAETRAVAASADVLKLPAWQRGASMRGIEKYLGQH